MLSIHITKLSLINSKQDNEHQIGNHWFGNHTAPQIANKLFHTYECTTAIDIDEVDDTMKIHRDPVEPIKMHC